MATPVKTEITLRTARGITGLVLLEIDPDRLVAEGEHTLRAGNHAEFQFALPGANANLRGQVEIDRVVKLALGPTRTVLRILEMNKDQQGLLREWLSERALDQGTKQPTRKPPPPSVEELRAQRSSSLGSDNPGAGVGRRAVREAITATPGEPRGARGRLRRGVEDRRGTAEEPSDPPRRRRRVEVKVAATATPPIVMVRFNDPERYVHYYWKHLHRDQLQVRHTDARLEPDSDVSVRLVLPGGSMVACTGQVRSVSAEGFALGLVLDDTGRTTLRLAAGSRPRSV